MAEFLIAVAFTVVGQPEAVTCLVGRVAMVKAGAALADRIRKQPFSVLLLNEFEKSHERVWDLSLQVLDDGRLTDRQGNTADFRHAIIIMTANVGAEVRGGPSIGFGESVPGGADPEATTRSLARVFRKEFLNRIDRIVALRPLSRAVMREVLEKELKLVRDARGWRTGRIDRVLAGDFDLYGR